MYPLTPTSLSTLLQPGRKDTAKNRLAYRLSVEHSAQIPSIVCVWCQVCADHSLAEYYVRSLSTVCVCIFDTFVGTFIDTTEITQ